MDVGDTIADRYRLLAQIGAGGMGVVWRALDTELGREVALKHALVGDARRLEAEARTAAGLAHPHVVAVFDVVVEDAGCWLVMEYVPSRSLARIIATDGPLPSREMASIGRQIADALSEVHARGIVHGDVTPHNILVTADATAKLTDFGISRALWSDATQTASGMVRGTPAYLAPEVARGETPQRESDMFSLGATLFYAVEGRSPLGDADNPMTQVWRSGSGHIEAPEKAGEFTAPLKRLLDVQPKRRPTADEARRLLADPGAARGRRWPVSLLAGAAIVVLLLVAGFVVFRPDPPAPPAADPVDYQHSLDPCGLISAEPLRGFGEPRLMGDAGNFDHCDVIIRVNDDGVANVQVRLLDKPPEAVSGWASRQIAGLTVLSGSPTEDECQRVILVDQRTAVRVAGQKYKPGHPDLCALADAAVPYTTGVLSSGAIPRRSVYPPAGSLAWMNSCDMADPAALTRLLGSGARPPRPGFAAWRCFWDTTASTASVEIIFDRDAPVSQREGEQLDINGRKAVLRPFDGMCRLWLEYRPYTNPSGEPRAEQVWIETLGEPPGLSLCDAAKDFAAAMTTKLPR